MSLTILLISTYEMGRQPFGLASPTAWLRRAGFEVRCLDLSIDALDPEAVQAAGLVAFYVPMHMGTRMTVPVIAQVRQLNPEAHLCCFGLYAPVSADYLRRLGVVTILGGEFEAGLVALARRIAEEQGSRGAGEQGSREDRDDHALHFTLHASRLLSSPLPAKPSSPPTAPACPT